MSKAFNTAAAMPRMISFSSCHSAILRKPTPHCSPPLCTPLSSSTCPAKFVSLIPTSLEEVPSQLLFFMKKHRIKPLPPPDASVVAQLTQVRLALDPHLDIYLPSRINLRC